MLFRIGIGYFTIVSVKTRKNFERVLFFMVSVTMNRPESSWFSDYHCGAWRNKSTCPQSRPGSVQKHFGSDWSYYFWRFILVLLYWLSFYPLSEKDFCFCDVVKSFEYDMKVSNSRCSFNTNVHIILPWKSCLCIKSLFISTQNWFHSIKWLEGQSYAELEWYVPFSPVIFSPLISSNRWQQSLIVNGKE